jgi:hypothetical protein
MSATDWFMRSTRPTNAKLLRLALAHSSVAAVCGQRACEPPRRTWFELQQHRVCVTRRSPQIPRDGFLGVGAELGLDRDKCWASN